MRTVHFFPSVRLVFIFVWISIYLRPLSSGRTWLVAHAEIRTANTVNRPVRPTPFVRTFIFVTSKPWPPTRSPKSVFAKFQRSPTKIYSSTSRVDNGWNVRKRRRTHCSRVVTSPGSNVYIGQRKMINTGILTTAGCIVMGRVELRKFPDRVR